MTQTTTRKPRRMAREKLPKEVTTASKTPSRLDQLQFLLTRNGGATITEMVEATGWQQHSVRGFLTCVVRKHLKLDLTSEKLGKDRIYRIKTARSSAAKVTATSSMT